VGLRERAASDTGRILEDDIVGAGWPIILIAPDGTEKSLTGFTNDIAQIIDPDTGQAVSGRLATVALRISSIRAEFPGLGLPEGIADTLLKPWIIKFDDINGVSYIFKISQTNPDRTLGVLICMLEIYKNGT